MERAHSWCRRPLGVLWAMSVEIKPDSDSALESQVFTAEYTSIFVRIVMEGFKANSLTGTKELTYSMFWK